MSPSIAERFGESPADRAERLRREAVTCKACGDYTFFCEHPPCVVCGGEGPSVVPVTHNGRTHPAHIDCFAAVRN